ncbi:alpha/beta fold hydrolase [Mesorhizobium sp. A623]
MNATVSVPVNGLAISTSVYRANREAPWLVFSNSLMTDMRIWSRQVDRFKKDYQILCYDQRGHGGTPPHGNSAHMDDLAGDVLGLLDHFDIGRCTFIGVSMGVPTGLALYRKAPERIARLVLSDGQARTAPGGAQVWEERLQQAFAIGLCSHAQDTLGRWLGQTFRSAHPELVAEYVHMMQSTSPDGFQAGVRALQNFDYSETLARLALPVLLVVGANDGNLPAVMQAMSKTIAGSRFVAIPDAGHLPPVEQPDRFNDELDRFLQGSNNAT